MIGPLASLLPYAELARLEDVQSAEAFTDQLDELFGPEG